MTRPGGAEPDVPRPGPTGPRTEALRLRERIYAVITMIALVVTLTQDDRLTAPDAAWSISLTAVGLWLATLVADQQAHRVVHHAMARGRELRAMLYTSSALLLSAVVPLSFTALAGLGVLGLGNALLTAVFAELAWLFAWGVLGGLRMGGGPVAAVLAGTADAMVGVLIVLVKVAAGH